MLPKVLGLLPLLAVGALAASSDSTTSTTTTTESSTTETSTTETSTSETSTTETSTSQISTSEPTTSHSATTTSTATLISVTTSSSASATPSALLSCPASAGQTYVGIYNHFSYIIQCPGPAPGAGGGGAAGGPIPNVQVNVNVNKRQALDPVTASAEFETCINACDATENCQSAVFNPTNGQCYTYNCESLPINGTWGASRQGVKLTSCPTGTCPSDIEKAKHKKLKSGDDEFCSLKVDSGVEVDYQQVGCGNTLSHMVNCPDMPSTCSCATPPPPPKKGGKGGKGDKSNWNPNAKPSSPPSPPPKNGGWTPAGGNKGGSPPPPPAGGNSDSWGSPAGGDKGGSAPGKSAGAWSPVSSSSPSWKPETVHTSSAQRVSAAIGASISFVLVAMFL
ncbi:hypothetical protein BX600DRAFT_504559 [Xylariales sp. PMI_506]|nr:hypothetical protein BX600DRAFT_504559 [Xylariales sp. PMI_506]